MQGKIVCITGLDRCGKATQARLLQQALRPSELLSFPDYSSWSGRIIRCILQEQTFAVSGAGTTVEATLPKDPYGFQALNFLNLNEWQERIREGREKHHWILDRGAIEAYTYGLVDGCDLHWLLGLTAPLIPSDYVIILLGKPFPRPGEEPDINERDTTFQKRVQYAYRAYDLQHPDTSEVIDVDLFRHEDDPVRSIRVVHALICSTLRINLGLEVQPLELEAVLDLLPQFKV